LNKFRRATVLLAEDSPDDVEITRRAFKRCRLSCELLVARDGEEALKTLRAAKPLPDFALLDINLPRLSGFQVLEGIRADPCLRVLPVIVLSASAREEDVFKSYDLGANSFIQKPVVFDAFLETLEVLFKYWFQISRLPRSL
jgi:two-component system response regulator